ncbi:hypothetical protein ABK040_006099 [Willaertia magna]
MHKNNIQSMEEFNTNDKSERIEEEKEGIIEEEEKQQVNHYNDINNEFDEPAINPEKEEEKIKNFVNKELQKSKSGITFYFAWCCAILVHILFGIHPIFSRYLQHDSENPFPPMMLITSCHLFIIIIYLPRMLYKLFIYLKNKRQQEFKEQNEQNDIQLEEIDITTTQFHSESMKSKILKFIKLIAPVSVFLISLVVRSSTNIASSKFAKAIYVQLFALTTPFFLTFLTVFIYNKFISKTSGEKLTLKSWIAMLFTVIGGAIIIIGSSVSKEDSVENSWYSFLFIYKIDWNTFSDNVTWKDGIGILFTVISSVTLAIYMLSLRFMKETKETSKSISLTGENLFILQIFALALTFFIPSLIVDDWSLWLRLNYFDWIMFISFSIFVFMVANFINIFAINYLGASIVGSILALRLVSTIVFSSLILQEHLKSFWQLLGSLVVLISVTYFLIVEYKQEKQKRLEKLLKEQEKEIMLAEEETQHFNEEDSLELLEEGKEKLKEEDNNNVADNTKHVLL